MLHDIVLLLLLYYISYYTVLICYYKVYRISKGYISYNIYYIIYTTFSTILILGRLFLMQPEYEALKARCIQNTFGLLRLRFRFHK